MINLLIEKARVIPFDAEGRQTVAHAYVKANFPNAAMRDWIQHIARTHPNAFLAWLDLKATVQVGDFERNSTRWHGD